MELGIFVTDSEHTDIQVSDGMGNTYCIRFNTEKQLVHTKLHKDTRNSWGLAENIDTNELKKCLLSQGSSTEELRQNL